MKKVITVIVIVLMVTVAMSTVTVRSSFVLVPIVRWAKIYAFAVSERQLSQTVQRVSKTKYPLIILAAMSLDGFRHHKPEDIEAIEKKFIKWRGKYQDGSDWRYVLIDAGYTPAQTTEILARYAEEVLILTDR